MGLRRRRLAKAVEKQIVELLERGTPVPEIARKTGVSRSKVYRVRKSLEGEGEAERPVVGKSGVEVAARQLHQEALLSLSRRMKEELHVPLWRCPIKDLGPAGILRGEGGLVWENGAQGICLRLPYIAYGDVEKSLLWGCLCEHLLEGGYSRLLVELDEWEQTGGQELRERAELLQKIDRMLKERLESPGWTTVREAQGEATPFFGGTLVATLVDGLAQEYSWVGEPGVPLYRSYCGEFEIGSATTREAARALQVHHDMLRPALDSYPLTQNIRALRNRRDGIASVIEKGLSEVLIQGYVPGKCGRCSPED